MAEVTKTETKPVTNPALPAEERKRPPRVPMNTARQRLQTREIEGYRLYWFKEENVPAALDAYYEFVSPHEVHLNQLTVSNSAVQPGGTDMGSRMSLIADKTDAGLPVRAYLMKIKLEYFKQDQEDFAKRNGTVLEAMFGNEVSGDVSVDDTGRIVVKQHDPLVYIDRDRTGIMNKKTRKLARLGRGRLT